MIMLGGEVSIFVFSKLIFDWSRDEYKIRQFINIEQHLIVLFCSVLLRD